MSKIKLTAEEKKHIVEEAKLRLDNLINKGDTIYSIVKHTSTSDRTRSIAFYIVKDNEIMDITWYISQAFDYPMHKSGGLNISGSSMDLGFHVVETISRIKFNESYAINHQWL